MSDPTVGQVAEAEDWPTISIEDDWGKVSRTVAPSIFDDAPVLTLVLAEMWAQLKAAS